MKKSEGYILELSKKPKTDERVRLIAKLRGHIAKVLVEYLPSLD